MPRLPSSSSRPTGPALRTSTAESSSRCISRVVASGVHACVLLVASIGVHAPAVLAATTSAAVAQSVADQPGSAVSGGVSAGVVELGFETEPIGDEHSEWFARGPGWTASLTDKEFVRGTRSMMLRRVETLEAPFGNVMRFLDAEPYRGTRVALRAAMRIEPDANGAGQGQMWMRVDRPEEKRGGFDNMADRPVTTSTWTNVSIALDVAPDATSIALGFMSIGGDATVFADAVEFSVLGQVAAVQPPSPPTPVTARGLENLEAATRAAALVRYFHPTSEVQAIEDWDAFTIALLESAEPAVDRDDLATRLRASIADIAPLITVWAGDPDAAPPLVMPAGAEALVWWVHSGAGLLAAERPDRGRGIYRSRIERLTIDPELDQAGRDRLLRERSVVRNLGGGVSCLIPYAVPTGRIDDQWTSLPKGKSPKAFVDWPPALTLSIQNRSTRLAAVAKAWGVFQHFYPYFDVVSTDWDQALREALGSAAEATDARSTGDAMRRLVAHLHDGHGSVYHADDSYGSPLPLALAWAGPDLVVVGRGGALPLEIALGTVIEAIDGRSAEECHQMLLTGISSATEGWARHRSAIEIALRSPTADPSVLRCRQPDGTVISVNVPRTSLELVANASERRPTAASEVAPGIVYFDLNRNDAAALRAVLPTLESAKGIIFDMRGYPGQAAYEVIQHLIAGPVKSARWTIPEIIRPDRDAMTFIEAQRWNVTPLSPQFRAPVAFLTDGRTISYAESIMGIVEHHALGEIVGATTAGTNGNVNPFTLPGGFNVSWTGMRVLKHDGSQHHGVGIRPTVPCTPTAKGIAEGRDQVLEKAIAVLQSQIQGG